MDHPRLTVLDHPLIQHKLTLMRDRRQASSVFRALLREIAMLMGYEITRTLPLGQVRIETPVASCDAPMLAGKKPVIVPILRAGLGMADGLLDLIPSARVGHIGLYRDPETLTAVEYYFKAPQDIADRLVIIMDPMLATGNSASAAAERMKEQGAKDIRFVCLLAAPEGIAKMRGDHPDIRIWTAAIDTKLNDHGYILPGLGDAGDRMFGTR